MNLNVSTKFELSEVPSLYIVPTPIGNLEDITLRALRVLDSVDVIACEDTRHTRKLLTHYDIHKKLISYHSHNEKASSNGIVKLIESGASVALVSDGGTPVISDPGMLLVMRSVECHIPVVSLPGATAFVPLLAASGFRTDRFYFAGFLSNKSARRKKQLVEMSAIEGTLVLYESVHRIIKLINDINEVFFEKNVIIGKEISKMNEKILRGTPSELLIQMESEKIAGEYVVLIANYFKK